MVNPFDLMKVKGMWDAFLARHPKLAPFGQTVAANAIGPGSVIDIHVTSPDGRDYHYNMRVSQEDMDAVREAREIFGKMASDYNPGN